MGREEVCSFHRCQQRQRARKWISLSQSKGRSRAEISWIRAHIIGLISFACDVDLPWGVILANLFLFLWCNFWSIEQTVLPCKGKWDQIVKGGLRSLDESSQMQFFLIQKYISTNVLIYNSAKWHRKRPMEYRDLLHLLLEWIVKDNCNRLDEGRKCNHF